MDKRVKKTKQAVFKAFLELLEIESVDKITISQVAKKADVNRSTVYFNFKDKNDILIQCTKYYINNMFLTCMSEEPEALIKHTFEYIKQNITVFKLITKTNSQIFKDQLYLEIEKKSRSYDRLNGKIASDLDIVNNVIYISSIVGVINWWIENDCKMEINILTRSIVNYSAYGFGDDLVNHNL